jgi:predicted ArsR family transcriptional regulator
MSAAVRTAEPRPAADAADTARHRALSARSRVRMLHLVRQSAAGLTAAEVAAATGLHASTVRAHLEQLAESGLLTRTRHSGGGPGRPAWRYRAVAGPPDPGDSPHRQLAAALISHLARTDDDPHAAGICAGRDWGRTLAGPLRPAPPVDGMLRVLDRLGFTPRVVERNRDEATVVHLTSCPFLSLAQAHPDVVCGVHQGVIGGALGAFGGSTAGAVLEPFAAPGMCVLRLPAPGDAGADREVGR